MSPSISFTLPTQQIVGVMLSAPAEVNVLAQVASGIKAAEATARIDAEEMRRTYHLGTKPTKDRGYDDRLTVRIGIGATLLREQVALWQQYGGKRGGLRHLRFGTKYIITEEDVREFLRPKTK